MTNQALAEDFRVLETGSSFISKNAKEFGVKYQKKFIAVFDSNLIAVDGNFEVILEKIKKKNIDPSVVLIEYIPSKDQIVLY
jgi:hypothetical protein